MLWNLNMKEKDKVEKVKIISNYSCQVGGSDKKYLGLLILALGVLILGREFNWWQAKINGSVFIATLIITIGLRLIFKKKS